MGRLLNAAGYSLQSNRKTKEGAAHPDRNAQFEHIHTMALSFQRREQPVISVDTKKKEWVGVFKNADGNGDRKASPRVCKCMTFSIRNWAKPSRMASTMWARIRAG